MRPLDLAERLAAIVVTQQEIASANLDLREVMTTVSQKARELTRAAGAVVTLLEGEELVFRAAAGSAEPHIGLRLRVDNSLSGHAIRTGEVQKCDNTELDPHVDRKAARQIGVRSLIAAPLLYRGETVGALVVISPDTHAFNDLDAHAMQLLAGLIAASLRHAEDFEQKSASEQRYRLLFERNVAGAFRTTLDGRVLDCNQSLARILGYASTEDLLSHRAWELYPHTSDREEYLAKLQKQKSLTNTRLRLRKKDGTTIETVVNANIVSGPAGETFVLGTLLEAPPQSTPTKRARARARRPSHS